MAPVDHQVFLREVFIKSCRSPTECFLSSLNKSRLEILVEINAPRACINQWRREVGEQTVLWWGNSEVFSILCTTVSQQDWASVAHSRNAPFRWLFSSCCHYHPSPTSASWDHLPINYRDPSPCLKLCSAGIPTKKAPNKYLLYCSRGKTFLFSEN